jgi:hypothetical protein
VLFNNTCITASFLQNTEQCNGVLNIKIKIGTEEHGGSYSIVAGHSTGMVMAETFSFIKVFVGIQKNILPYSVYYKSILT